jgi:hypothetical protein
MDGSINFDQISSHCNKYADAGVPVCSDLVEAQRLGLNIGTYYALGATSMRTMHSSEEESDDAHTATAETEIDSKSPTEINQHGKSAGNKAASVKDAQTAPMMEGVDDVQSALHQGKTRNLQNALREQEDIHDTFAGNNSHAQDSESKSLVRDDKIRAKTHSRRRQSKRRLFLSGRSPLDREKFTLLWVCDEAAPQVKDRGGALDTSISMDTESGRDTYACLWRADVHSGSRDVESEKKLKFDNHDQDHGTTSTTPGSSPDVDDTDEINHAGTAREHDNEGKLDRMHGHSRAHIHGQEQDHGRGQHFRHQKVCKDDFQLFEHKQHPSINPANTATIWKVPTLAHPYVHLLPFSTYPADWLSSDVTLTARVSVNGIAARYVIPHIHSEVPKVAAETDSAHATSKAGYGHANSARRSGGVKSSAPSSCDDVETCKDAGLDHTVLAKTSGRYSDSESESELCGNAMNAPTCKPRLEGSASEELMWPASILKTCEPSQICYTLLLHHVSEQYSPHLLVTLPRGYSVLRVHMASNVRVTCAYVYACMRTR